jgi:predicted lipoprotein with Yx(FWY)xxD motif/predicted small secreted protein
MRSIPNHPRIGRLAALTAAILLVAACTGAGQDVRSAAPAGSLTPAASASASTDGGGYSRGDYGTQAPAEASSATAEDYVVNASSGPVGAYLTGKDGLTLYTFKADGANTSTCTGGCAETWQPFVVTAADTLKAGSGVTGTLTTFARPDGSMQVAYNGAPLYSFKSDTKAGDTNGQGIGGSWFVAAP